MKNITKTRASRSEDQNTTSTETEDFSQDLKLIEEVRAEAERNPTPEMQVLLDALEMVMEEREQERTGAQQIL